MSAYTSRLMDLARRSAAEREKKKAATKEDPELYAPLDARLRKLLKEIPEQILWDGITISYLQSRLRGRRGGMAHVGELGRALRSLGYERVRSWNHREELSVIWRKKDGRRVEDIWMSRRARAKENLERWERERNGPKKARRSPAYWRSIPEPPIRPLD
jgi:hypothetical protein